MYWKKVWIGRDGLARSDFRELSRFKAKLERKLQGAELEKFMRDATKFLTAQFLAKVIEKTPVDDKSRNHRGGTLRRGWIVGGGGDALSQANVSPAVLEALAKEFASTISVRKSGKNFIVRVDNPTPYASYVEFGHRTRNGGGMGFVEGQKFQLKTEMEIQAHASAMLGDILEQKIQEVMR